MDGTILAAGFGSNLSFMKASVRAAALIAYLSLPSGFFGQNTSSASLLVLSKQDHTLSIVDAASLQVVAKVPVGNDPHEIGRASCKERV